MLETALREDLDPHWQATLDDLEARLEAAVRRRETLLRRSKRYKGERDLERVRNDVLRAELARLDAMVATFSSANL